MVVGFVLGAEAMEDGNGLVDGWGVDANGLEAAFESGVLFDIFAVFVHGGGADALQFAAREGRFNDIGGIHGTFGRAGADEGMKFVDKEEDAFEFTNFFHNGFDAFLELSAVLGTCDHESEIEGDDFFITKNFRNVARGDLLGEAFDDGGFTDASFTDEDGIIFGAAAKNLDDSFDFVFTADDGIEFIFAGEFGEVAAEGFEGGSFDVLARRARGSAGRGFGGVDSSSPPAGSAPSSKLGSSSLRTSWRARSISTSRDLRTRAATPSPSRSRPRRMCSVPT